MALLRLKSGKKPDRKRKIIEAATELLLENGSSQLNLLRVAMKSGVAPDQINLHFISRDGLMDALAESLTHENLIQFRSRISNLEKGNSRISLDNLINALLEHMTDKRNAFISIELMAMANQSATIALAVKRLHENTRRVFAQALGLMPDHIAAGRVMQHLQLLMVFAGGIAGEFGRTDRPDAEMDRIKHMGRELLMPQLRVELEAALQTQSTFET